jgi:hypothetical protein
VGSHGDRATPELGRLAEDAISRSIMARAEWALRAALQRLDRIGDLALAAALAGPRS